MINWFLVVIAVIVALLTVGVSIYLVLIFTTPSELRVAILPKIVAILGLALACFIVLLLPYDAANKKNPSAVKEYSTSVDTVLMWEIVFWAAAVWILILIPFSMFFYEAHDPEQFSFVQQCVPAFLYTLGVLIAFLVVFLALYLSIGVAQIPYWSYTATAAYLDPFDSSLVYSINKATATLEIKVSAFVYLVGLLVGVGWILFLLYGGVGLVAVPVGLSRALYKIPKRPLSESEFVAEKERIAMEALNLMKKAQLMQKSTSTSMRTQREINEFRAQVNKLENGFSKATSAYEDGSLHYVRLVLILFMCLVCTTLTVLWLLHIFIYNTTNYALFLNAALLTLDNTFTLFGVLFYGIFAFYLLWCAIAGCIKVGLRFTFFAIHPMKYRDTRVNSILFNIGLMLITSIAVVQFCAYSFVPYVSNTAADALFDTYVRRLKGIGQLFIYFQWCFVGIAALSIFWVIICPRPKPKPEKEDDD